MARKISPLQLYHGPEASIPSLEEAEPGWASDGKRLYIGNGDGTNTPLPTKEDVDSKQDKITGAQGQIVGFDSNGDPVPQSPPDTGVITFNGRTGAVSPAAGDYTAEMVGARPSTWTPSAADVGAIPSAQKGANGGVATLGEDGKLTESQRPVYSSEDIGAIPESKVGSPDGIAPLGSNGLIPAQYIPGGLDEIKEFDNREAFPNSGEDNIYYLAKDTSLLYRWSGSEYVPVNPSLALGETSSTAYRGDHGLVAYNHSLIINGNPHGTTAAQVGAISSAEKGVSNGVATLDENGKLTSTQKPTYTAEEVGARPATWTPSSADIGADPAGTATSAVNEHNSSPTAHQNLFEQKQDKLTGTEEQIVGFDSDGNAVAKANTLDTASIVNLINPVGSLYFSGNSTNPGTLFAGTTWEAYATGKTLIGVDPDDSDFNEADKTGGTKSIDLSHTHTTSGHALTTSEMPSHTHSIGSHTHEVSLSTTSDSHWHSMSHTHSDSFSIGSGGSHTHSVSITTGSTDLWGQVRIFGFGDSTTQGAFSVNSKSLSLAYPSSGKSWGYMTLELDGTHTSCKR